MNTILKLNNVNKTYNSFSLKNISFQIREGDIIGLLGRNGSGKTSTIKAILDLITIDGGEIDFLNGSISENFEKVGVVLEQCNYFDNYTVSEVKIIHSHIYKNWDEELFKSIIRFFALPLKSIVKNFSQGMRKQLCLAVVLSFHPKLLILDELTSGLDPSMRESVWEILKNYVQSNNNAVLFSTHVMEDIIKITNRIIILNNGEIVENAETEKLLGQEKQIMKLEKIEEIFKKYTEENGVERVTY